MIALDYSYSYGQFFVYWSIALLVGCVKEYLECSHISFEHVLPICTEYSTACFWYWRFHISLKCWHFISYLTISCCRYCAESTCERFEILLCLSELVCTSAPYENVLKIQVLYTLNSVFRQTSCSYHRRWESFPKAPVALDILTLISSQSSL